MTAQLTKIFRHPIKSHGVEALKKVTLSPGQTMPWDRRWAVPHEAADIAGPGSEWKPCNLFSRGAKTAALMALRAHLDPRGKILTLTHPDLDDLTFWPDAPGDSARFLDWLRPLNNTSRARPVGIVRARDRGMTDTDFPSLSILSERSLSELSHRAGQDLSPLRFRGNLWIDGLPPWEEFDLVGQTIRIGSTLLRVREIIGRCRATGVNPTTGAPDVDTLGLLQQAYGHTNFGVYAEVLEGGALSLGDPVSIESA